MEEACDSFRMVYEQLMSLEKEYGRETLMEFIEDKLMVESAMLVERYEELKSMEAFHGEEMVLIEKTLSQLGLINKPLNLDKLSLEPVPLSPHEAHPLQSF